jgi:hypothetical protein
LEGAPALPSEWFEKHRFTLVIILGLAILILQIVQLLEGRGPDFTGTAALVAGLGPGGTAVIIPGDLLSDTVAPGPPNHQSSRGAAVRLRQTGAEYSITFVRS